MKKISSRTIYFASCILFTSTALANQTMDTYVKSGHIYLHMPTKNQTLQITHSGLAHDPVLSPNKKWLAFVMRSNYLIPRACAFSLTKTNYADEAWIVDLKTMHKKIIVPVHADCDHPEKTMIDPSELHFSPDSKTLYFATSAWATSGAVHAVDIDGKNLRFITAGNEYHVVMHGKYRGDLIVNQHRYHDQGGSFDWDWLFTPTGKQIKLYQKED